MRLRPCRPHRRNCSVPPDLLAAFSIRDLLLRGGKGKERRREGQERKGKGGKGQGAPFNFLLHGAADVVTPLNNADIREEEDFFRDRK